MTPELAGRQEYIHDLINIRDEHLTRHRAKAWYCGGSQLLELVGASFDMRHL